MRARCRPGAVLALALAMTAGCSEAGGVRGPAAGPAAPATATSPATTTSTPATATPTTANRDAVPDAGRGTAAASQRRTFVPTRIRLLSQGGAAVVQQVDTGADGDLELPEDPGVTGWWVSGALPGEVYGSVVLAGHIDSRDRGIGFFATLLDAAPGDRVELSGGGLRQVYVVRSNREVAKGALSTGTDIFDRSVPGRLVLLTCTGTFDPVTRHYDHNLVVTAAPVGAPTAG